MVNLLANRPWRQACLRLVPFSLILSGILAPAATPSRATTATAAAAGSDTFAGSSLDTSKWNYTNGSAAVTVNNGLTITEAAGDSNQN